MPLDRETKSSETAGHGQFVPSTLELIAVLQARLDCPRQATAL